MQDFLWTGEGEEVKNGLEGEESEEGGEGGEGEDIFGLDTAIKVIPTSVYVTRMSTVYTTVSYLLLFVLQFLTLFLLMLIILLLLLLQVIQPTPVYLPLPPGHTPPPEGGTGWSGVTHPAPWPPAKHSQPFPRSVNRYIYFVGSGLIYLCSPFSLLL